MANANKILQTGSLSLRKSDHQKRVINEEMEIGVLAIRDKLNANLTLVGGMYFAFCTVPNFISTMLVFTKNCMGTTS
ncbi:hypothetical protein V1478_010751 [Vespula squamosa]|uniref:Uncharacterized protein n=1 Tax=Vespula squamosa TaxID=30214 RepID=A0ABD2AF95_VESSQ